MIEVTWGLHVTDEVTYADYRAGMKPILATFGGKFVLDLRVSDVLLAPGDAKFNRLFTIRFPSPETMEAFFRDPDYRAVRKELFDRSATNVSEIARYNV